MQRRPRGRLARRAILTAVLCAGASCMAAACGPPPTPAWTSLGEVAPRWIQSDRSSMDLQVREGHAQSIVDLGGAAWSPNTGTLGGTGTMVLFGHRESHGAPFRNLDLLRPGDTLNLTGSDGRNYTYAVVTTRVTAATWEDVLRWTPPNGRGLALVTCHPLGSTSERLVVEAQFLYAR